MLRVIIALPTSNETVDIFEQTITGFSSVNTRLAFDTEVLLKSLKKIRSTKLATVLD